MRVRVPVLASLIAMALSGVPGPALAVESNTFYLTDDGLPQSTLALTPPKPGDLSNFDPGRDIHPGLGLGRTPNGMQETDGAKYQHWQTHVGGIEVSGIPTLVLWVAIDDFDESKTGVFTAYLLDCPEWGYGCSALSAVKHSFQPGPGDTWVETMVTFPELEREFEDGRQLGVRVVVSDESEADLWLAYDRLNYRSRLVFSENAITPALADEVRSGGPVEEPTVTEPTEAPVESVTNEATTEPGVTSAPTGGGFWEWLVSVVLSGLMLGGFALVLIKTLLNRGEHKKRPTGRIIRLTSSRPRG